VEYDHRRRIARRTVTYVYALDHPHGLPLDDLRALVGGKAANIGVMMNELGLPVPPGLRRSRNSCGGSRSRWAAATATPGIPCW
jgi:hypothetical protein